LQKDEAATRNYRFLSAVRYSHPYRHLFLDKSPRVALECSL
jgi:hypothetical protein